MPEPQSYKNHTRFDPLFHFIVLPLLIGNLGGMIHLTIHEWPHRYGLHLWWIVMSLVFIFIAGVARSSALRAQDRTILLEERLRYNALLPPSALATSANLAIRQIIALRFASDAELPGLITRAASEKLSSKQIKESIVSWRADDYRV